MTGAVKGKCIIVLYNAYANSIKLYTKGELYIIIKTHKSLNIVCRKRKIFNKT